MIRRLFDNIKTELEGKLPKPGHYDIRLAAGDIKGATDTNTIQKALVNWIKEKAPNLKLPSDAPAHMVRETPEGVPFEVSLYRWYGADGKLRVTLIAPEKLEDERLKRIKRALEDKCPKLQAAKGDSRCSILLLESDDICLGDNIQISKSVLNSLEKRTDIPDEIYLVETEFKPWILWKIKEGSSIYPDLEVPYRFTI